MEVYSGSEIVFRHRRFATFASREVGLLHCLLGEMVRMASRYLEDNVASGRHYCITDLR